MSDAGPVYLRWRAGGPKPEEERYETLDAALDAAEARWEALQHQAPQVLDRRRVLLASTEDLRRAVGPEDEAAA